MSLTLIGLGLYSEKDLSLRAVEEAKNSDIVYIELFTSKWHGKLKVLENIIGKKITELSRTALEDNSAKLINDAKNKRIILFVQGDPLCQTTHSSLLVEARKKGIKTRVIHNASIISAIGETGLHLQKFGPYVTLPFPEKTKSRQPESVFEIIKENKKRGLHTLCLLDVISEKSKYMGIGEGLNILLSGKVVDKKEKLVALAKVGSENPVILYGAAENLIKKNVDDIPAAILVPAKLHFTEKEYLETLADTTA